MKLPKKLIFILILFVFKSLGYALFKGFMRLIVGEKKKPASAKQTTGTSKSSSSGIADDQERFARYQIHPTSPKEIGGKPIIDGEVR